MMDDLQSRLKASQSLVSELTRERDGLREALEAIESGNASNYLASRRVALSAYLPVGSARHDNCRRVARQALGKAAIKAAGGEK